MASRENSWDSHLERPKSFTETEAMDYRQAGLARSFVSKVQRYRMIQEQMKELEETKRKLSEEIQLQLIEHDARSVLCDDARITLVDSSRSTLKKEKLLELGVAVDIIEAATVTTQSSSLRIVDAKTDAPPSPKRFSGLARHVQR